MPTASATAPIGVCDSGIGGLTVLRELAARLPHEDFLYLGDSARLPYGTKNPGDVVRCSLEIAATLMESRIKMLVIACNTITAPALPVLRRQYPHIPIIGVIEPGVTAACAISKNGIIALIATQGTINSGAYQNGIRALRPDAEVLDAACPLFVMLAEEGILEGEVAEAVARHYLAGIFNRPGKPAPDSLLFGCTHFPPLGPAIAKGLGVTPFFVNPAANTAEAAATALRERGTGNPDARRKGTIVLCTTAPEAGSFARAGGILLGRPIAGQDVRLVSLKEI